MKYATKLLVGTVLSFLLAFLSLYPTKVYAATQISTIKISVEEKTSSGSNPMVRCNTSGCFIVSDSTIWSKNVSDCDPGDTTYVTIKLDTNEGYFFKDDIKKSKIQVTNGECCDFKFIDQGQLSVKIKYTIHGDLDSPDNLYWDEDHPGRARWDGVGNKATYTIQLCKGSNKVTVETGLTKTSYDFSNNLKAEYYFGEDDVYFRVKAVPKSGYSKQLDSSEFTESDYFDYWDDLYDEDVSTTKPSSYSIRYYPYGPYKVYKTGWEKVNDRWCYYESDGQLVKNKWHLINGRWYYFDKNGWMDTGWFEYNGQWYYLNTYNGNGDMLTGWQFIDGYWYFFDIYNGNMVTNTYIASSDGSMMYYIKPDGRMQTGWVNYYGDKYIDPVSGVVTKTR